MKNNIGTSGNPLTSKVTISDGAEFNADAVNIESVVKPEQNLDMQSLDIGAVSIGVQEAELNTFTNNSLDIGNVNYKNNAAVQISNSTLPTQNASVAGLNVGVIASGTQAISAQSQYNAETKLKGAGTSADAQNYSAKTTLSVNGKVDAKSRRQRGKYDD